MGTKILGVIAFAAIAAVAGWNYQQNKQSVELSDLALANIEALASGEGSTSDCETYCKPDDRYYCIVDYGTAAVSCPQHRKK
ncbi:NVEALA domain-containing protein [Parabacteroides sp.]